jgi:Domain of unknown function DUF11
MSTNPLQHRFLLRAVSTAGALSLLGGFLSATPAYADPPRADLAVTAVANPAEVVDVGGGTTVTVDVGNAGTRASREFTLAFALPAGAWFATEGFVVPPSWQCDLTGTATCTHAPLAAGAAADPLRIPIGLPAAIAGDTVTVSATAITDREPSTGNNTGRAAISYIPSTVDLFFGGGATNDEMIEGDQAYIASYVGNAGTRSSEDVAVSIPVPGGMANSTVSGDGWTCAFGDTAADGGPGWRCTHAPLAPGQNSDWFTFSATVSGVAPGDVLPVDLEVSTTSPESSLDNNTENHTITVVQAATVRGTVWVDQNRNGIRDATDPGAPVGPGGIDQIILDPQIDGKPSTIATVNPDGTYVARVVPGSYRTEFYVQNPHTFIDSPDSDVVYYLNNTGGANNYGYTAWFTVAGGGDAPLDAGVL